MAKTFSIWDGVYEGQRQSHIIPLGPSATITPLQCEYCENHEDRIVALTNRLESLELEFSELEARYNKQHEDHVSLMIDANGNTYEFLERESNLLRDSSHWGILR